MRLVVPFRSQEEVSVLVRESKLQPNILLVLVPGVREGGYLEPAPEITGDDIPHIPRVPSHIVPVGPDGSVDGVDLRPGDMVFLTQDTPPAIVWAVAAIARNLGPNAVCIFYGTRTETMAPIIPAATPVEATEEYDYGGD